MKRVGKVVLLLATCVSCLALATQAQGLIISEVAWAGTAASSSDEWIELRNTSDQTIDLAGWVLLVGEDEEAAAVAIPLGAAGENTLEARTMALAPDAFLLLERTDDKTVSDIAADVIYTGTLSNSGIQLHLVDPSGDTVDFVELEAWGWPGGGGSSADIAYATMERGPDLTWTSNDGIHRNGLDADGEPMNGTPGQVNSAEIVWAYAPHVFVEYPQGDGLVVSGTVVLSWTASDPDGAEDALRLSIDVSANGGIDWEPLVGNLANAGSYVWDTSAYSPCAQCRLRISAVDPDGHAGAGLSSIFELE